YWKSHNWAEAIPAIEKLIGRRGSETVEDAARLDRQRVMQLAVALNLADDKAGLRRLRERYNGKMAGSPDQAAFDLITEQNNPNERSEEHTSELQSREKLVCRLLLEKKKKRNITKYIQREIDY